MKHFRLLLALLLVAPFGHAAAQNIVKFSAGSSSGAGTAVPVLTWCTETGPNATTGTTCTQPGPAIDCTASGAANWTGTKAAAGTATLPAITANQSYSIACRFSGDSIVTFSWTNPTQNTDNTPYTNPKSVRIKYTFNPTLAGSEACNAGGVSCVDIPQTPAPATTKTVTGITQSGLMLALAFAINQVDEWSAPSNMVMKIFTGVVSVTQSVAIEIRPVPKAVASLSGT